MFIFEWRVTAQSRTYFFLNSLVSSKQYELIIIRIVENGYLSSCGLRDGIFFKTTLECEYRKTKIIIITWTPLGPGLWFSLIPSCEEKELFSNYSKKFISHQIIFAGPDSQIRCQLNRAQVPKNHKYRASYEATKLFLLLTSVTWWLKILT